jgi:hypothetical protein
VERLINSLDGTVNQGKGSRVWFTPVKVTFSENGINESRVGL